MADTAELTPERIFARKHAMEIVEKVLGNYPGAIDDTFEELGADSVDLIAMEIEVEEITGKEIEVGTFQGKTVGDFAAFIEERLNG
ncbi:acyl carrier protein [Ensifer sp. WSM1721]|uniref:acyl carrier protein n=1 Tax=Ensifer sp. WSM1721 TaxID=1041159 RepID=UPI00047A2C45|nr:acyl carrier protein [Ensifer sp. WSM1721]